MLFSGRLRAGFLPGWLSLVRPREGSQSAGLIIWFEKSGGRGFDKGPLSRAPPPALYVRRGGLDFSSLSLDPKFLLSKMIFSASSGRLLQSGSDWSYNLSHLARTNM